jgi:hypothetical protein
VDDTLERDLCACAREFVNGPHGVADEPAGLALSSIFEWYRKDFGSSEPELLRCLATHAEAPLREHLLSATRVADYRYDWRLNDRPGPL